MRGKAFQKAQLLLQAGITPAYAGKRWKLLLLLCLMWDHPRICGEKLLLSTRLRSLAGSPPHMRGKVQLPLVFTSCRGITPAHAGKSRFAAAPSAPAGDHPRTCGEKIYHLAGRLSQIGSPPHMRGKAWPAAQRPTRHWITPAHAGKSSRLMQPPPSAGDHPRTCGEKLVSPPIARAMMGSPPHMRGKGEYDPGAGS